MRAPLVLWGLLLTPGLSGDRVAHAQPPAWPSTQAPGAQVKDVGAWDSSRARELAQRAVARRAVWARRGAPENYRARARGHIYFLYDLGRGTERHLVKADQLALDLYWRAPGQTHQVIVGRREQKALPTGIRYHLDHLTVVMDNLGDRIRLGEGSEVREALHPAAKGALDFYQYRLTDSLTLVTPRQQIRVYEVEVRPADPRRPGLVGSLYLDRATADIVRMDFTFTAASYLDETLDYFNIRLENALWQGRYWLPYRQGIELRRGIEAFKFPAGGIIRAEFRIGDYRFDTDIPEGLFRGRVVTALPPSQLDSFQFDAGLLDALDPEVATSSPSMEDIRDQAATAVAESYLQRAEGLKLAVPGASSVLRFRRAEGLYMGPGVGRRLQNGGDLALTAGYAIGADRWQLDGVARSPPLGRLRVELRGYYQRAARTAPWPRSSGALATMAALLDGQDYRDAYWASGGTVSLGYRRSSLTVRASLAWEEWEAATLQADDVIDRRYRPVRELDEGEVAWLALELGREATVALESVGGFTWSARIEGASRSVTGDFTYLRGAARAAMLWPDLFSRIDLRLSGSAGTVGGGRLPAQRLFASGGRGTVRGYAFDRFVGNLHGALSLELRHTLRPSLLSLAAFADLGWVGVEGAGARDAIAIWNSTGRAAGPTRGPLVGVGLGVGLLFDILHVELARGLRQGGLWNLVIRVRPELWPWL